jgi:nitrite reductase (NADH) small subunit
MTTAPPTRVRLCVLDDLPEGIGRAFRVGDQPIAVFRTRTGKVFAVEGVCPHRGGPLADGMLAGDQVVCPFHAFRFDARAGGCDQPNVCSIRTYPVEVQNGTVVVTV